MKIEVLVQNITKIEVDAIVNSANSRLIAGSGVCGAIHAAAGKELEKECLTLGGCEIGQAKYTGAYNLPAKYVIHTVGPRYVMYKPQEAAKLLASCYSSVLDVAKSLRVKTISFPLISGGIFGYPTEEAVKIACETVLNYPDADNLFDAVFFVTPYEEFIEMYKQYLVVPASRAHSVRRGE